MRWHYSILFTILCISMGLKCHAQCSMEFLINKNWNEIDIENYQPRGEFYIRYTGTQRMIIGENSEGITKAKVQEYYLSDKPVVEFDRKKVGKVLSGNYLVFRNAGDTKSHSLKCYEIKKLNESALSMSPINDLQGQSHYYVTDIPIHAEDKKDEQVGNVISTLDLLTERKWYEINEKTGEKLYSEVEYDKSGKFLHCRMGKNPQRDIPEWNMFEFYLSDNIEYEFKHSKIGDRVEGRYIVVKEKDNKGNWRVANYDITTLSANLLKLECVYPSGIPSQVYMSKEGALKAKGKPIKPRQWQLMENEWHRLDTSTFKRRNYIEQFKDNKIIRKYVTTINGIKEDITEERVYYMSNTPDTVFDHSRVGRSPEGEYIVINEHVNENTRKAVSYQIDFVDQKNMLLSEINGFKDNIIAYERDLSEDEKQHVDRVDSLSRRKITTMDFLSGKQWRFSTRPNHNMSKWQRWYFTDSLWLTVDFNYDLINRCWATKISSREFYLSEFELNDFSMGAMKKKYKNGRYINFYSIATVTIPIPRQPVLTAFGYKYVGKRQYHKQRIRRLHEYKINFISNNLLSYETVPIEYPQAYTNLDPTSVTRSRNTKVYNYTLVSD